MKKNITRSIHAIIALLLISITSFEQKCINPKITELTSWLIKSGVNKKNYVVTVLLPKNYSDFDSTKYPVLYVLDGKYSTASFCALKENFGLGKEIKDIIYVTIDGNTNSEPDWLTNRYTDLTPTSSPSSDTAIAGYFKLPISASGGAAAFLATLEDDIIPFIDHKYKTNTERGIFGHSLGGLFVAYCLLTRPVLFQKYSINSPSVWWNNGEMIKLSETVARQNKNIAADIFISAGSLEGDFMITPLRTFIQSLKNNFRGMKITEKIFEDETHLSVVAVAGSRTLKVLYAQ